MKTKLIILTSILITLIVGITILFSYSYFNANVNTSNTAIVNTTLPNGSYTFTTSNSGTISYTFTANKMLASASSTTAVASDDANVSVSLKSPDANTVVVCTYDLVWEWTGTDQYTTSDTTLPLTSGSNTYNYEMSVKGTSATTGAPTSLPSVGATLAETDLSKFTWTGTSGASGYKAVIVHNASIASASTTATVTNWDLTSSIYNIPAVQTKLQNKNFKAKIYVSNVDCNANSKLPSGYTQVNYIETSTATTVILNTDLYVNNTFGKIGIDIDMLPYQQQVTYQIYLGASVVSDTYGSVWSSKRVLLYNTNGSLNYNEGFTFNKEMQATFGKRQKVSMYRNTSDLYDTQISNNYFVIRLSNGTNKNMKLFRLVFYQNDLNVREYIPCFRTSDNKSGLYEIHNKTFVYNDLIVYG